MIDTKKIEQLARQIHNALPEGIRNLGGGAERKIRQILQGQLNRMEIVSRDEFDVQTQVLMRTREKLTVLEQRLDALEHLNEAKPKVTPGTIKASSESAESD